MQILSSVEVNKQLEGLAEWAVVDGQIAKTYQFQGFRESIVFVDAVAVIAESQNHHPDIDIRFTSVRVSLTTHSAGGLTELDFKVAHAIDSRRPQKGILRGVDAVVLRAPSPDEGIAFYADVLGHQLLWRRDDSAGFRMDGSHIELVISTAVEQETDLLVDDVPAAMARFSENGGMVLAEPFDIPVGRVGVVKDPFGNTLTLIDLSKGRYVTSDDGTVTGVA